MTMFEDAEIWMKDQHLMSEISHVEEYIRDKKTEIKNYKKPFFAFWREIGIEKIEGELKYAEEVLKSLNLYRVELRNQFTGDLFESLKEFKQTYDRVDE